MDLETRTIRRVSKRLVPFIALCFFVAYLDRVNVSFAALTMNKDLGLSAAAYGFGAGIFFLTYFFFEVPSNLMLERFGARKWIARIMLTWGILSAATAFVTGETSFYVVRGLLGIAEAGFFPGVIFYLTLWFPAHCRARILGYFYLAIPLSNLIGSPVSGWLVGIDGALGLKGWQWLFILEAAPSVVLSFVVFYYLTDRPADAKWLKADERSWLIDRLETEKRQRESVRQFTVRQALLNPAVLALALVYFGAVSMLYGLGFFLPQIVKAFGLTDAQTGVVSAIPYLIGSAGMVLWGRRSDRLGERKFHIVFPMVIAGLGLAISTLVPDPTTKLVCLSIACFGIFAAFPVFWTLPTAFLSGAAAAGGIAIINSIGNLAGFAGPYVTGYLKDVTGSFNAGLLAMAGAGVAAAIIVASIRYDRSAVPATFPLAAE
jgi:MFS transporter, ACS family, tartrate transporter